MPQLEIGPRTVTVARLTLRVSDAAEVLSISLGRVRRLVTDGRLTDVGVGHALQLDPAELVTLVGERPLALGLLAGMVAGERSTVERYRSLIDGAWANDR